MEEIKTDKLKSEIQQLRKEILALRRSAQSILKYQDFNDSAKAIFDFCKNLIGASAGYIALLDKSGKEYEILFLDSGGLQCTVDPSLPMLIRGLRAEIYRTGKAAFDNDFSNSKWVKYLPDGHATLENVLFAPLKIEGNVIGLLGLANKKGGFTNYDAESASTFGEIAAIALANSRSMELLKHSEERFRSVAQTATDAIIICDSKMRIVFINRAAEEMFGYATGELINKPDILLMSKVYQKAHKNGINRLISTGQQKIIGKTVEIVGLKKNDNNFPIELSLSTWKEGEEIFFAAIIRDITERKHLDIQLQKAKERLEIRVKERTKELLDINKKLQSEITRSTLAREQLLKSNEQLHALYTHLESIREEERKKIALEIHDELGQSLTGLKMDLSALTKQLPEVTELFHDKARSMSELIDETIDTVRKISTELRPTILDDLGLIAAIEWQSSEFQNRSGIKCRFTSNINYVDIDKNIALSIFRILQEILTNVSRHSNASLVNISLKMKDDNFMLKIKDNGLGIKKNEINNPKNLGILGMYERASFIGGNLSISGSEKKGTSIVLIIPLKKLQSKNWRNSEN
ncbi:MAG: PAS domain S-box protein [Actinobacteria bacterium]|nr:PAS domain S-box protein [Actinomycetota bacterium]